MTNLNNLSVAELQAIIENAELALEAKKEDHRKAVYAEIKKLAASIGATVEITLDGKKVVHKGGGKVPPKYVHPDDEHITWTGRGMMPKWMRALIDAGHDKSEFLI